MLRFALLYISVAALFIVVFQAFSPTSYNRSLFNMASGLYGWFRRARPGSQHFVPEQSALRLIVIRNAPADPEGFTLALFDSPEKIAVDAAGRVHIVEDADFQGLMNLAGQTKDLPATGTFRNTWVIEQLITSQPIERILIPRTVTPRILIPSILPPAKGSDGMGFEETSVQGYDGVKTKLKIPVGGIKELPPALFDLVGLVLEGREGLDGDRDESMIKKIKDMLGDVL